MNIEELITKLRSQIDWLDGTQALIDMMAQAADTIERLEAVNKELLAACYAVLHDCDDIDMVASNEPGRDKGPWLMLNEAIAYSKRNE